MDECAHDVRTAVEGILENQAVQVVVDCRRSGIQVPDSFRTCISLKLNFSYLFRPQDLTVDDEGIRETLSYGGMPFLTFVPWCAILACRGMKSGQGQMFLSHLSQEMGEMVFESIFRANLTAGEKPKPAEKKRGSLRVVH
jgi:stringent starvation protein B